ncbi:MAG: hypothetical protein AB1652_02985 [Bacillota bacterium]
MDNEKFQELVMQQLNILATEVAGIKTEVSGLKNEVTEIKTEVSGLKDEVAGIKTEVNGLKNEFKEVKTIVTKLELRLENEAFNKIGALFDSYKLFSETLTDHTRRLQRIEDKITTHDIQIQVLDKTKSNKRKVK